MKKMAVFREAEIFNRDMAGKMLFAVSGHENSNFSSVPGLAQRSAMVKMCMVGRDRCRRLNFHIIFYIN